MPDKDKKDEWEEKPATEFIRERGEHFHRRRRKLQSLENRRLSRDALRLLRHILKVTPKENPIRSESIRKVAKRLGIDPSTGKRLRRRFCEVGVLKPRERKGGRGICAQYWVDLEKAEALVREGRWGATKKRAQKREQKQNRCRKLPRPNPLLLPLEPHPRRPNHPLLW